MISAAGSPSGRPYDAEVAADLTLAYLADPNSVHTRRWIGFFAERGHEVHLLVAADEEIHAGLPERVAVHRYRQFAPRRLPFVSSLQGRGPLRALLRATRPDVLHAHRLTRHGWQARLSGFHPYVVSPWGSDLYITPRESIRARAWARLTLAGADLVTVNSRHMGRAAIAAGARSDRVKLVRYGVDLARFAPGRADPELRARLGLPPGRRLVFSPRAMQPLYRHDLAVSALTHLPDDVTLVMSGRNAAPGYAAALSEDIARRNLTERVRILPDIDEDDMIGLFRDATVVLSIPDSDAVPRTVLEAMACEQLVVTTDHPGIRELLEPVAPHLLVPAGDATAVTEALNAVLSLPAASRREMARRLRPVIAAHAEQVANMERMEAHYRLLRRRAR
jgi:glycosyltransferase involved in cell wall biosynthesis